MTFTAPKSGRYTVSAVIVPTIGEPVSDPSVIATDAYFPDVGYDVDEDDNTVSFQISVLDVLPETA